MPSQCCFPPSWRVVVTVLFSILECGGDSAVFHPGEWWWQCCFPSWRVVVTVLFSILESGGDSAVFHPPGEWRWQCCFPSWRVVVTVLFSILESGGDSAVFHPPGEWWWQCCFPSSWRVVVTVLVPILESGGDSAASSRATPPLCAPWHLGLCQHLQRSLGGETNLTNVWSKVGIQVFPFHSQPFPKVLKCAFAK